MVVKGKLVDYCLFLAVLSQSSRDDGCVTRFPRCLGCGCGVEEKMWLKLKKRVTGAIGVS